MIIQLNETSFAISEMHVDNFVVVIAAFAGCCVYFIA